MELWALPPPSPLHQIHYLHCHLQVGLDMEPSGMLATPSSSVATLEVLEPGVTAEFSTAAGPIEGWSLKHLYKVLKFGHGGFKRRGDDYCPGIMLILHSPFEWKSTARTTAAVSVRLLERSCISRINALSSIGSFHQPRYATAPLVISTLAQLTVHS